MRDLVLDPFVGSGTTIRVCKKLGRDFIGIDINSEVEKYTGIKPSSDFDNPRNKLFIGDCLEIMTKLYQKHGEFVDLIYADPPFGRNSVDKQFGINWKEFPVDNNILKMFYGSSVISKMEYERKAFLTWLYPRIVIMKKILKPTGSLYLHSDSN